MKIELSDEAVKSLAGIVKYRNEDADGADEESYFKLLIEEAIDNLTFTEFCHTMGVQFIGIDNNSGDTWNSAQYCGFSHFLEDIGNSEMVVEYDEQAEEANRLN